jgi:hypothetical protein
MKNGPAKNSSMYKPSNPASSTQRARNGTSAAVDAFEWTCSGPKPYQQIGTPLECAL